MGLKGFEVIEVDDRVIIPTLHKYPKHASTEIELCFKHNGNRLGEFWVQIFNGDDPNKIYHGVTKPNQPIGSPDNSFVIHSFDSMEQPRVWSFGVCKTHKNISVRMFVPVGTMCLEVSVAGLFFYAKEIE